jgi:6-pyruvoyl-tetrahydropterin synthase
VRFLLSMAKHPFDSTARRDPFEKTPPRPSEFGLELRYTGAVTVFRLSLQRHFVADHFHDLPGFQEARHGHNWELEATVALEEPQEEQLLTETLDAWIKGVDYRLLNELPALAGRNPTAEALAQWAFRFLEEHDLLPVQVKVREKANYWAACRSAGPQNAGPREAVA